MGAVIFLLVLAFVFLLIGLFLFFGKGSWLIAGYNTASQEEKEKYDKKKLCRAIAVICFVVTALLCAMAYLGNKVNTGAMAEEAMLPFVLIYSAVLLVTVVLSVFYINKKCKK